MKSKMGTALALSVAWALSIPALSAQSGRAAGPGPQYDRSAEATVSGTVLEIQNYQRGRLPAIHLTLKTDSGTLDVHLGPSAYMADQGFTFAKGDAIQVLGARVTIGNQAALIAREVTKDGKKLTLRDAAGRPLWSRGARRVTG